MPAALDQILEEIKSLEPLPQVAMRVVELAAHDEVVPGDLVAVIQTDAAVTAKVLKLCNSAYYGFKREIGSLPEAGNLLGVSTLVNLVLTSCTARYFRNYGSADPRQALELWERSVVNGLATSLLARLHGGVDKNRAYTSGLLMNVGQLVLDRFLQECAPRVEAEVERGLSRLQAEEAVLGMHHAEIGARLAERWNFPEVLVDAIRHHHTPEQAKVDPLLASLAHLAECVTAAFVTGKGLDPDAYGLDESALRLTGLDRTAFDTMEEVLTGELHKAREFLSA